MVFEFYAWSGAVVLVELLNWRQLRY